MTTVFNLLRRGLATRGRVAALLAIGGLAVLLGFAVRASTVADRPEVTYRRIVTDFGFGLLVPVVALVFSSAAFGDLVDDGTLVYLWLRPVARWRLTATAFAASVAVGWPLAVLPLVAAVAAAGVGGRLVLATAVTATVALIVYSALFLALGLRVRRALVWGLAYVLIWEGAVARAARGAARLSVSVQSRSLLASLAHHRSPRLATAPSTAVVASLIATVLAYTAASRWLRRADVA